MSRRKEHYEVEKGLPIPEINRGASRGGLTDKLRHLEIGDSVLTHYVAATSLSGIRRTLAPIRFATRKDAATGRVRVWRVE